VNATLDVFQARQPSKTGGDSDFGLLYAVDDACALYGWITNTGAKFVVAVETPVLEGVEAEGVGVREGEMKGVRMGEKVRHEWANEACVARYSVPSRRRISRSSVIRSSITTRRVRLRVGGFWRKLRRLQRGGDLECRCRRESGDTLSSRYRFLSVQVCILATALWVSYPSCASPTVSRARMLYLTKRGSRLRSVFIQL